MIPAKPQWSVAGRKGKKMMAGPSTDEGRQPTTTRQEITKIHNFFTILNNLEYNLFSFRFKVSGSTGRQQPAHRP